MCLIEQHQDSSDNLTLDEARNKYSPRAARAICPREKALICNANELRSAIGGNAKLEIYSGNCSSFSCPKVVGINLRLHNRMRSEEMSVSKIQIDLYVLAHEFGHQAQVIHQKDRYKIADKRSKEANADYFAGIWIGIKLGQDHNINIKGLSRIAFNLKGGGDGPDKYPYPEQREQLLLRGIGYAAAQQLVNVQTQVLVQALTKQGIGDIWNASDQNIADWDNAQI